MEVFENLSNFLVKEKPVRFDECITWARFKFQDLFYNNILQLLYNFPRDSKTSSGAPFWSGPKRAPDAIKFDASNVFLLLNLTPSSLSTWTLSFMRQTCTPSTMDSREKRTGITLPRSWPRLLCLNSPLNRGLRYMSMIARRPPPQTLRALIWIRLIESSRRCLRPALLLDSG